MITALPPAALLQLETGQPLDLLALVATLDSGSLHTLFANIVEKSQQNNNDINDAFYIHQAKDVRAKLTLTTEKEHLLDQLCQQLAVLQTGSALSKYCSGKSFHLESSYQADVVMLGDSITEWAHWHELMPSVRVANRGISGDVTQGMLQRLDGVVSTNPKQVFFMAGVNDLSLGFAFEGIVERYQCIVNSLCALGIDVVVQSTLLVGERLKDLNPQIIKFNQINQQWCDKHNIKYIDLNSVLAKNRLLQQRFTFDDLHLNGPAYQQWLECITPYIIPIALTN